VRPDGIVSGIFCSGSDVTERVQAEDALRRLTATLEEQVEARTQELQQAEAALRQSQKMEAIGQLTGGIAHDFNNLILGVTGSLGLAERRLAQGRSDDIGRFIDLATTSAKRAASLTHRLLAFSRRQPLDPRPVRVNALVASTEDLLRRSIGESIELDLVLAEESWLTVCDPHQLENAILNLAINARDAMPEGGKLTIETGNAQIDAALAAKHPDLRPGQYMCLSVTDTGIGMSPDVIARAFDPFFTTKPIGQGTGLGLSMIYGFVRQSGGDVQIESDVDQGTTVKLYLPRSQVEIEDEEALAERDDVPSAEDEAVVLVVEDEPDVRAVVIETLHELGYRTLEAADGRSGLGVLQSSARVDLLVSDIGLPGMSGRQMVDAARQTRPDLKVLFITGYAAEATSGRFLQRGMALMTKPFDIDALALRVRDMINGDGRHLTTLS
jgi:signal transduction histidine kinase/ActR/RegA family two-component response regulator